jgi:glycosyltransferase 2 family protein
MGDFLHAVRVFFDHLAAVHWEFLAIGLGLHIVRLVLRAIAWRTILKAAYPKSRVPLLSVLGAYVAGVAVNSIVPARGGDLVKLYLVRHRIRDSSYATLAPTLIVETLFDFLVGAALLGWALSAGVLPTHKVYSRLPAVDWKFFLRHEQATAIGLLVLGAAGVIAFVLIAEHGDEFLARFRQGFAIFGHLTRLVFGVILPQALSWVLRIGSIYYFLKAFDVHASIHNALLAQVVESLATLFPATPGGAGTKQGLIVFLFAKETVSKSALLAFSVGMNIATVALNVVLGLIAIGLMARTLSFRRLRVQAREEAPASGSE